MTENMKRMIEDLNKDLELEYAAAIQYLQHQSVMTGGKFESIRKELLIHSQEEMNHAVMVAQQIDFLGGVPTIDVEKRVISSDTLEMLKQDLAGEENAITRYKKRITQAEGLQEYGLRRTLEDILIQEEEHKRDLLTSINENK